MDCVFEKLGFNERHGATTNKLGFGGMGCEPSCTEAWDRYDYISDTPVQYMLWPLLKTHPDALVILPTRDPAEWQRSRLDAHSDQGAADWYQAAPCGRAAHKLSHKDSPTSFVVYNVWVDCVVLEKNLFKYNLFDESELPANTIWRMVDFLKTRNITIPNAGVFMCFSFADWLDTCHWDHITLRCSKYVWHSRTICLRLFASGLK